MLRIRARAYRGAEIALGPGKADLLEAIAATGSIRKAAGRNGMSYPRAWKLVRTMNACFEKPLVVATRGGTGGGRARLSPDGRRILRLYRKLEADCLRVAQLTWGKIELELKR